MKRGFFLNIRRFYVTAIASILAFSLVSNGIAEVTPEDIKIGAYYYIWWGIPFNNHWEHGVKYNPFLGQYCSNDSSTADKHILLAKDHGIDFFAVSWLGHGSWIDWWDFDDIDRNLRDGLLKAPHIENFTFCLFYETQIVLRTAIVQQNNFTEIFINDIVYAAENYFVNPSYLRFDGKPVLCIYNLPYLYQNLSTPRAKDLFDTVRERLSSMDLNVHLIGDVGPGPSPNDINSDWLYSMDAVTNYFFAHHLTSLGWQTLTEYTEIYYPEWRYEMTQKGIKFIPNAYSGFDNTEHCDYLDNPSESLVLSLNETMFREMLNTAIDNADDNLRTILITSWNEWLESTAIEPSMEFGELFLHTVYTIPEFPSFLIPPLFMIATLLAVIIYRRKQCQ